MRFHAFTNVNGEWQHIIEPTPIWLPHIDPQDSLYYTIKKGDTLTSIAKEFNVTIESIVRLNDIKDINLIYAGDRLRIEG